MIANSHFRLTLGDGTSGKFIERIELCTPGGWFPILLGCDGQEFATSVAGANAATCSEHGNELRLTAKTEWWEASSVITLEGNVLRRTQTYRFLKECEAAIYPGFRIKADANIRYTFPLRAHEQPLAGLSPLRSDVTWALPLPFHIWHNGQWLALYGVDRSCGKGTLDFTPADADGLAALRVYYPDTAPQIVDMKVPGFEIPQLPGLARLAAGDEVVLTEVFGAKLLAANEEPLLEATMIAADILLRQPRPPADLAAVANRLVDYFTRCELWEPDALGKGRGWFRNMWVRTQVGVAKKEGDMSGYFDLGWGEGIAVEMWMGAVRHWRRTGDRRLLVYVDETTRNMDFFKRGSGPDAPYYDRTDGKKCGDFLMDLVPGRRIWTHSLGHTGSHLIQLFQLAPDYPNTDTRQQWLAAATSIGNFFAKHQRPNGDLQDIFGDDDQELNKKPHRITARAVVCGLWTRLSQVTGDKAWMERALRLSRAVAPEITRYEYFNQMLDGIYAPDREFVDGEAAYYALEGLGPLYGATGDPEVLALCKRAAAFGFIWTYFFDVPKAHNGIARGGQCCRMPDYPLVYVIGAAKAIEPLLSLAQLTGDSFYQRMAAEMIYFITCYQKVAPGKPWDGSMIHAIHQSCGGHWGPDLAGSSDTGMSSGNSLAALEAFMEFRK